MSICPQAAANRVAVMESHWFTARWRPAMAWLYLAICAFDFIAFPAAHIFYLKSGAWVPLTLTNGGIIHVAFGAIIGINSWTRGEEKKALYNALPTPEPLPVAQTMTTVTTTVEAQPAEPVRM